MRLLFCCEFYYPSVGGVQEVMRQLAERMVQRGHQVTVATSRLANRTSNNLNGVNIEEFGVTGNAVRGMSGEVHRYRDFILHADVDAILIKAAQQWTFDALWPIVDEIRTRKVFIPCGFSGLYQPAYADYFRQLPDILRSFDHLIFYASNYRDIDFTRNHGMDHFTIIPNGASEVEFETTRDRFFRERHNISSESFVFMTVGSLTGMKGHLELAKAFLRLNVDARPAVLILNGNNVQITAVVSSPEPVNGSAENATNMTAESPYQTSSKNTYFPFVSLNRRLYRYFKIIWEALSVRGWLGILDLTGVVVQRRVPFMYHALERTFLFRFLNPLQYLVMKINNGPSPKRVLLVDLPRHELIQAYKNADLFVFASNVEYSPLVLFEAAAAGLPFLTVPVGNAVEIADWTGCGVICPANVDSKGYTRVDPGVFAKHMREAMESPYLLQELGQRGHERWKEKYSWSKIVVDYEKVLAGSVSDK